jgi:hypothetical protein
MATVSVEERRQVPVAEVVTVRPDDRGVSGAESRGQRLRRARRAAGARPGDVQAEPVHRRRQPPVEVLPGVGEAEGDDAAVVVGELPQDVAGTESAADEEQQRLGQRPVGSCDPAVREHVGQRRRVWVDASAEGPSGVDDRADVDGIDGAAEQVGAGDGVALAGAGHPRAYAGLELLSRGHGRALPAASAATGSTHRPPPQPWHPLSTGRQDCAAPRGSCRPLCPASPARVEGGLGLA